MSHLFLTFAPMIPTHPIYKIASPLSRKLSSKKQALIVKELCRHYGVSVRFFKRESLHPGAGFMKTVYKKSGPLHTIYIYSEGDNDYIRTFFHELGHIHCWRTGKWLAYHTHLDYTTPEEQIKALRAFISTGFRAEQWVDRWAASELKKWFKRYPYDFPYSSPGVRQWYEDNYLAEFREKLAKLLKTLTK